MVKNRAQAVTCFTVRASVMRDEWKAILAYQIWLLSVSLILWLFTSWIGMRTGHAIDDLAYLNIEKFKQVWQHHQPFTLQGGGMFHLAFGALLTGSALNGYA